MKKCILIIIFLYTSVSFSSIKGHVFGVESRVDTVALQGANVFWLGTKTGTTTDKNGYFSLSQKDVQPQYLVINYVSFKNDTVLVTNQDSIQVFLDQFTETSEITIVANQAHTIQNMDAIVPQKTISTEGLRTMACCSMAECFENTSDVDVEASDAVSGAKRIKMLGLSGYYTQILIEKTPVIRGLLSPFGLEYVPGAWLQSIDISKGTASVANGYESTTGQINVEFFKPESSKPISLNLYQNSIGKTEGSILTAKKLNDKVSTMLLAYGHYGQMKMDKNNDTFLDMPLSSQINIFNRWKYKGDNKAGQVGFKFIDDQRNGGQKSFDFGSDFDPFSTLFGFQNKTRRYEFYTKMGYMLDTDNPTSVALVASAFNHNQQSYWGKKEYTGHEQNAYVNLFFDKNVSNLKISSGFSYIYNKRQETFQKNPYDFVEKIPGGFTELTLNYDKLTTMFGIRYDHHNHFGNLATPRFHAKYEFSALSSLRISAGKGYRTPSVFMENLPILASAKKLVLQESLIMEEAWNAGIQVIQNFSITSNHPVSVSVDYYRTEFVNQVVVDMEQDVSHIILYNLDGKSYSNSAQIEVTATAFPGFEATVAGRLNDVKTTYGNSLKQLPLNSRYKGMLVLSYSPQNTNWQFDLTTQWNSSSRLPRTDLNPEVYQTRTESPAYAVMSGQIKRKFDTWEVYIGMENITNYRQTDPILAWQEPFSDYFDSSMVWGPIVGRRLYVGWRF